MASKIIIAASAAVLLPAMAMASQDPAYAQAQSVATGSEYYYPNNNYCQVKGFPGKQFKVGCSYTVPGKFNCYGWNKMTLWCTSGGPKGKYYYCCGNACYRFNVPNKCGAIPPAPKPPGPYPPGPYPPPYPSNNCNYGQGKQQYAQCNKNGATVMQKSFDYTDGCDNIDTTYKAAKKQAPSGPPCCRSGYLAGVDSKYNYLQGKCINDCAGSGKMMGQTIGQQFCAIAAFASSPTKGVTQQICNAVESTQCRSTYETFVNNNCPDKLTPDNQDYFDSLANSCDVNSN